MNGKEKIILTKTGYVSEYIEIAKENLIELGYEFFLYSNDGKYTLCRIGKVDKLMYDETFDNLGDLKKSTFPGTDWRIFKEKILKEIDKLN